MNPNGIVTRPSPYSVKESIDRFVRFLEKQGATIYARIDQQSEVNRAGLTIGPLEFLLFGDPKAGGIIMKENPVSALDLPLKIIAWQDADKKVWIAYNEAAYIEKRHSLPHSVAGPLNLDALIGKVLV